MEDNALKAISMTDDELRVGNHIILFNGRDLEGIASERKNEDGSKGEYFTPETVVESAYTKTGRLYVDWEHGQDPDGIGANSDDVLGYVDWKTAVKDDKGIYVERVLNRRAKYMDWLEELITAGLVGNSSEAITQSVKKDKSGHIKTWPLRRDTLTVNPMEPRMMSENALHAYKSIMALTAKPEAEESAGSGSNQIIQENKKMENEEVKAITLDEVKAVFKEGLEEFKKAYPVEAPASNLVVTHDEADNEFTSIADQARAVKAFSMSYGKNQDVRLGRLAVKASGANEAVPSQGGFILEPTLVKEILKPVHEEGPFSAAAKKLPVGSDSNYGWINGIDETDRATGSRWGGIRGYRLAEGAVITASKPKFRRINWELKKYAVACYATDELLADASQFSAVLQQGASEELSFMVNDDILNGVGVGGPLGILNSGALVSVTKETSQVAATVVVENLNKMWQRLHPRHRARAAWYINSEVEPELDSLALAVGTAALEPRYVTYGMDGVMRIKGRPVIVNEFSAALGTQGDILLADMSDYLLWEKNGVQAAQSTELLFLYDESVFRFIYRCDGQTALASALTPYKGSNTQSPFVALDTRA
jgi:HK97 family phage major capsid protein